MKNNFDLQSFYLSQVSNSLSQAARGLFPASSQAKASSSNAGRSNAGAARLSGTARLSGAVQLTGASSTNLRRDAEDPSQLRRTGVPTKLADVPALPFAQFVTSGGRREVVLMADADFNLSYITGDAASSEWKEGALQPVALGNLGARPILTDASASGVVKILCEHAAPRYLTYEENDTEAAGAAKAAGVSTAAAVSPALTITLHGAMPELPRLQLTTTHSNTLYETVPQVKLSGASSGAAGSQLVGSDARALEAAVVDAYTSLQARAASSAYCMQPVIARYRLLDAAGNSLAVGPNVLLSAPGGMTATDDIVQTADTTMTLLSEGSMHADVFRPAFVVPEALPAPWNRLVAMLVIEMTDAIDPLDATLSLPHAVHRDRVSGAVTVESKVPGMSVGMVTDEARFRRLAEAALTAPMYVAAEYSYPFAGSIGKAGSTVAVPSRRLYADDEPTSESASQSIAATTRSWSAALRCGDLTVLCNPRYESFPGWEPELFIAARDSATTGSWRLAFGVEIATSSGIHTVVKESTGTGHAPTALTPVLLYPGTDAISLTVHYSAPDGKFYRQTYPLRSAGNSLAAYVANGLKRITFTEEASAYTPQGETLPAHCTPGCVELYPTSDLRRLLHSAQVCTQPIHTVAEAPRGDSGWDFARRRILFFSREGTAVCNLNTRGEFHSICFTDYRSISSPQAVCRAADTSGAALRVIAGNDLCTLSGRKTGFMLHLPDLLPSSCRAYALTYCPQTRETWLATTAGLMRISDAGELFAADLSHIGAGGEDAYRFGLLDGRPLLAAPGGLFDLSRESTPAQLHIYREERYRAGAPLSLLSLRVFASEVNGTVILLGDRGTEVPEPLLTVKLEGALNGPLHLRPVAPYRDNLRLRYDLTVSADFTLCNPVIC